MQPLTPQWDAAASGLTLWLATYLLHSTLWLAAAWIAARLAGAPALRERLWKAAIVGGLATATLHGLGARERALDVAVPVTASVALDAPWADRARLETPIGGWHVEGVDAASTSGSLESALQPPTPAWPWYRWVALAWILGAGLGVVRYVGLRRRLRRSLAHRTAVRDERARGVLERISAASGRRGRVRLTSSTTLASPIAVGRSEVCLPERALTELDEDELGVLLAHELAHLERRDPIWRQALALLERLFFLQPLLALAGRALERESELECDAAAVRWTGSPLALARCLHAVAAWSDAGRAPALAVGMVRARSPFVHRVERALAGPPRSPSAAQRAACAVWVAACFALLTLQGPGLSAQREPEGEPVVARITEPPPQRTGQAPPAPPEEGPEVVEPTRPGIRGSGPAPERRQVEVDWTAPARQAARSTAESGSVAEQRARLEGRIQAYLARRQSGAVPAVAHVLSDGSVVLTGPAPDPERPGGARASYAIDGRDPNARVVLVRSLAEIAARMPVGPVDPSDPASPRGPSGEFLLNVASGAPFRATQEVLAACAHSDVRIWNVTLVTADEQGRPRAIRAPLPWSTEVQREEGALEARSGPGRIEVRLRVLETGSKVDPETGVPWTGEGPFAFACRRIELEVGGPLGTDVWRGTRSLPGPGRTWADCGAATPDGDVGAHLSHLWTLSPNSRVVIDARPGAVYGEVVETLDAVILAGFTNISFTGSL